MKAFGYLREDPRRWTRCTFYFENFANLLDQFLIDKNMAKQHLPIAADPSSVEIIRFPGMVNPNAIYPAPIPFGGMGKPVNRNGFSDRFPIGVHVTEAD
jgi:hypothetical protein